MSKRWRRCYGALQWEREACELRSVHAVVTPVFWLSDWWLQQLEWRNTNTEDWMLHTIQAMASPKMASQSIESTGAISTLNTLNTWSHPVLDTPLHTRWHTLLDTLNMENSASLWKRVVARGRFELPSTGPKPAIPDIYTTKLKLFSSQLWI